MPEITGNMFFTAYMSGFSMSRAHQLNALAVRPQTLHHNVGSCAQRTQPSHMDAGTMNAPDEG